MKSVVITPALNESENIPEFVRRLRHAGYNDTILVVDDSLDDKTAQAAKKAGCEVIHRTNKKGLASAVIDGIKHCNAEKVIVMDTDLQHPPELIPKLLKQLDTHDFVIASRYVKGGRCDEWTLKRKIISRVANLLAFPLTSIKDSASGFFGFRQASREVLDSLSTRGFKIMLELLVRGNFDRVIEIPFTFGTRTQGQTKLGRKQVMDYLLQLVGLYLHQFRWLKFGMIGAVGAFIHFTLLYTLTDIAGLWYILSAILSIIVASTFNYALNHKWTFRERAISNHAVGWAKYQVLSAITDGIYLGLLALFVEVVGLWYIQGAFLSVVIIFPIKYKVASTLIWCMQRNPHGADYDWHSFYRGTIIQRWWKQSIAKTIWDWIPSASSLLDIGCGSSPIISRYSNAIGVDTNEEKLAFMRKKCTEATFKRVDTNMLMFEENSFDYILCIELLEHLPRPELTIALVSKILKPEGQVVIATPDYSRPLWYIAERFTPYREEHVTKFTRRSLEEVCGRHGLRPVKHKYIAMCDLVELFEKK